MPKLKQLCLYLILISVGGLAACANINKLSSVPTTQEDTLEKFAAQQQDDIAGGVLPSGKLTPQLLFRILEGDIAAQRGQGEKSVPEWMRLAKETQDARAAKHATLVAISAKNFSAAQEAAQLWIKLAPESRAARQLMIGILLQNKKMLQIVPHVQMLLRSNPAEAPSFFAQMHLLWGQQFTVNDAVHVTEVLTQDYLHLPEAKFALAYAKQISGSHDEALHLLSAALKQKPNLEVAKNLYHAIVNNPNLGTNAAVTLTYTEALAKANALWRTGDYQAAKRIYEKLLEATPDDIGVLYSYGLVAWQQGDLSVATERLTQVEAHQPEYVDEVRLYLGRIAEQGGDFTRAQTWYRRVQGALQEEARRALVLCLAKDKQLSAALKLWRTLPQSSPEQRIQTVQIHAQIYAVNKAFAKSIVILTQALKTFPHSADLYYDRALNFEKIQHLAKAEADLRHALTLAPDNSMILNGLGFILADHNQKLPEAEELIRQARERDPGNLYIEDSWGWLLYRQGKFADAEKALRQVFLMHKDPEVIAHLIEVLSVQGKSQEAQQIVTFGLQLYPDNDILLKMLKRLGLQ
jgi:tetratricopeptide (TPR) repeat protein